MSTLATANMQTVVQVQSGDTYKSIAETYKISIADLERANNRQVGGYDLIFPGEKVAVPKANTQNTNTTNTQATQSTQQATTNYNSSYSTNNYASNNYATSNYSNNYSSNNGSSSYTGSSSSAKDWIANRESGGSYTARNGRYYGKYQLDSSYLNGDYSVGNQERVADNYVSSRYGSWDNAKNFWLSNGWY